MSEIESFASFGLCDALQRALSDVGYDRPTAVQRATFELISKGRDVTVQSRTGSGKTAAFAIPLLDKVLRPEPGVQALVLCPTRELALQVAGEFERLGAHSNLSIASVYGGAGMQPQIDALRSGAQVVVGTPGRVLDHLRRGTLDPTTLRVAVLDEGDEMLSMGFAEELNAILERLPRNRQMLIFSATMPDAIQRIAQRHQRDPETVALSSDNIAPVGIVHQAYFSAAGSHASDLAKIIEIERPDAALVFCNTKAETETIARALQARGLRAEYLNGDLTQGDRERVLGLLREEKLQFLVATDVAARGIDVPHLTHVINVGFPDSPEAYVHRTGRTGRAGRTGTAISLVGPRDIGNLYLLRLTYGIRPIERELPSEADQRTRREVDRLNLIVEAFPAAPSDDALALARRVLVHDDADKLVASLVGAFFDLQPKRTQSSGNAKPAVADRVESLVSAVKPAHLATPGPAEHGTGDKRDASVAKPRPRRGSGANTANTGAGSEPARQATERERREKTVSDGAASPPRRVDVRHGDANSRVDEVTEEPLKMDELRLAVGRKDDVRPGELARLIREATGLSRHEVGRIHLRDRVSLVSVPSDKLDAVIEALKDKQWNDAPLAPERGRSAGPVTLTDSPPALMATVSASSPTDDEPLV